MARLKLLTILAVILLCSGTVILKIIILVSSQEPFSSDKEPLYKAQVAGVAE